MIDYEQVRVGDKLRITGMGAPGFAKLGDIVTVESVGPRRVDVVNDQTGEKAYFALTCGAQRLEPVERDDAPSPSPASSNDGGEAPPQAQGDRDGK